MTIFRVPSDYSTITLAIAAAQLLPPLTEDLYILVSPGVYPEAVAIDGVATSPTARLYLWSETRTRPVIQPPVWGAAITSDGQDHFEVSGFDLLMNSAGFGVLVENNASAFDLKNLSLRGDFQRGIVLINCTGDTSTTPDRGSVSNCAILGPSLRGIHALDCEAILFAHNTITLEAVSDGANGMKWEGGQLLGAINQAISVSTRGDAYTAHAVFITGTTGFDLHHNAYQLNSGLQMQIDATDYVDIADVQANTGYEVESRAMSLRLANPHIPGAIDSVTDDADFVYVIDPNLSGYADTFFEEKWLRFTTGARAGLRMPIRRSEDGVLTIDTIGPPHNLVAGDNFQITPNPPTVYSIGAAMGERQVDVITLELGGPHVIEIGNSIEVSGLPDSSFNGIYGVSATAPTSISYNNPGPNANTGNGYVALFDRDVRPRQDSALLGMGDPILLGAYGLTIDNDLDFDERGQDDLSAGVTQWSSQSATPGCYDAMGVVTRDGVQRFLELAAGTSTDAWIEGRVGQGGNDGDTHPLRPHRKDRSLTEEVAFPIFGNVVTRNEARFTVQAGPEALFYAWMDADSDQSAEIGLGTEDGKLTLRKTMRRVPMDPLFGITTEVVIGLTPVQKFEEPNA